jgi:hypothetical protein
MKLERSAKIYGIIFGSMALILLILVSIFYFLYQKKSQAYNYAILERLGIEAQSMRCSTVADPIIRRVISGQQSVWVWQEEQSVEVMQRFVALELEVDGYGLPLKVYVSYDEQGEVVELVFESVDANLQEQELQAQLASHSPLQEALVRGASYSKMGGTYAGS